MVKSTKKAADPVVDDAGIFGDEPVDTKDPVSAGKEKAAADQTEADAKQVAADEAAVKAEDEAKASVARVTQGNGPELIALRTIKGLGGKDKVIFPNQGPKSLFRCLDGKERQRLIGIGAAMEQDSNDESRIIVPR